AAGAADTCDDGLEVGECTISRCRCLSDQAGPDSPVGSMNSTASQSSISGWLGGSLWVPRSSLVLTRPVPKYACQTRFTNERAAVGDLRSTSHLAKVSRSAFASLGSACRNAGTPGDTGSPG